MLSQFSYPALSTRKFSETVAFYEDHFDFKPALEMEGFCILKREGAADHYIAVIDSEHQALPDAYKKPVQGLNLNNPVDNDEKFYDYD